jgi:hypothetical protein
MCWSHHEMAWVWLKEILPLIKVEGGVLLNDFGHLPSETTGSQMAARHYGGSLANGINLQELAAFPSIEPGWQVAAPETDSNQLTSRWICRHQNDLSAGSFRRYFDGQRRDRCEQGVENAGTHGLQCVARRGNGQRAGAGRQQFGPRDNASIGSSKRAGCAIFSDVVKLQRTT